MSYLYVVTLIGDGGQWVEKKEWAAHPHEN